MITNTFYEVDNVVYQKVISVITYVMMYILFCNFKKNTSSNLWKINIRKIYVGLIQIVD